MPEEANKEIVLQYVDAFNCGDIETLRSLFAPDALVFGVLGSGDLEVVQPIWREIREAFAITLQVDAIVAEGDTVAVRYTERGTSVGSFQGQAATGQAFEVVAMEWFVIQNGLIYRRWGARDSAAQFRQMGLAIT